MHARTRSRTRLAMDESLAQLAEAINNMNVRPSRLPPPPVCSGQNIDLFFTQFEKFAGTNYGDDRDVWLQLLPEYLSDEPKQIVRAYGADRTYTYVKSQLVELFTNNALASRGNAYSRFFAASREIGETLRCFGIRLSTLATKIDASVEGKDVLVRSKFMGSLKPDVANQLKVHLTHLDACPTAKLIKMASALEDLNSDTAGAFAVSHMEEDVHVIRQNRQSEPPYSSAISNMKCFSCGRAGHLKRNCPLPNRETKWENVECFRCGKRGHFARNCGQYSSGGSQHSGEHTCVFCGGKHLMSNCDAFKQVCMSCSFCGDTNHRSVQCNHNPAKDHINQGN